MLVEKDSTGRGFPSAGADCVRRSRAPGVATLCLLFLALASGNRTCVFAEDAPKTVRIGVLAKRGSARCLEKWSATARYLSDRIPGHTFTIIPLDFEEVDSAVEKREVDFVLVNPAIYVGLEFRCGVSRIATLKNHRLGGVHMEFAGVILHRADRDDIKSLADLKGKRFMAVSQKSFAGWYAVWRELKAAGVDPHGDFASLEFGGTHDAVVYAVRDGKVDAGAVRTDTLERMDIEGEVRIEDFRVIHEHGEIKRAIPFLHSTRVYPEWPFAALQHVSRELAEKTTIALLDMPPDSPAAKAAICAGWTVPLNYQPVHECLKELRAGPYKDFGKVTFRDVLAKYWPWLVVTVLVVIILATATVLVGRLNHRLAQTQSRLQKEVIERRRKERELRKAAAIHEAVIDGVTLTDMQGTITDANRAATEQLGYTKEDLIGKALTEVFFTEVPRPALLEATRKLVSGEETACAEYMARHKSGREFPASLSLSIQRDETSGEPIRVIAVHRDVTERKAAERQIEIFRRLVEESRQGCGMADLRGNYTYANPALLRILGEDKLEDVVGTPMVYYYPDEIAEHLKEKVFPKVLRGENWVGAQSIVSIQQRTTPTIENFFLIRNERGTPLHIANMVTDMTEHVKAAEELAASNEKLDESNRRLQENQSQLMQSEKMASIGQLAAGVAHEINNPVGFVMSNIGTLTGYVNTFKSLLGEYDRLAGEVRGGNGASHEDILTRIDEIREQEDLPYILDDVDNLISESVEGTERIRDIVHNLKSFARVDEKQVKEADINEGIEATLKIVWNELKYKCDVHKELGEVPLISCNPGQLNQVFMNLLVNAAHAIDEHGDVTISTCVVDGHVEIRVSDTGRGIDPEHLSRIFDPFFTTKETGKGTGLGLSISHGIVEDHNGTIEVESELGKGTTFTVRLPLEGISDE